MMRLTRTGIGLLTAQYRSVLKKCFLINAGVFGLMAKTLRGTLNAAAFNVVDGLTSSAIAAAILLAPTMAMASAVDDYIKPADYTEVNTNTTITSGSVSKTLYRETPSNGPALSIPSNTSNNITISADFVNNISTNEEGGGLNIQGTGNKIVQSSRFIGNSVGRYGAAMMIGAMGGTTQVLNSLFIENYIDYKGTTAHGGLGAGFGDHFGLTADGNTFIANHVASHNSAASAGAMYTWKYTGSSKLGDIINSTFISNYVTSNYLAQAGAILINGSIIGDMTNLGFTDNYAIGGGSAKARGGAIALLKNESDYDTSPYYGAITNLTGTFLNNYVKSEKGLATGGAIYNSGTISTLNSTFVGNYAVSEGGSARGGAIYNQGTITNLTGEFIDNYVKGVNESGGSAIYNAGTITNLSGTFKNNTNTAIVNAGTINNITGAFWNNHHAIYLSGDGTTTITNSIFGQNSGGNSSSIMVENNQTAVIRNSVFDGNNAMYGGAIYVFGSSTADIYDSIIQNNYASATSGGIFAWGNVNLHAQNSNVIFNNNKSRSDYSDVYANTSSSTYNLNAAAGKQIYFGGGVKGNSGGTFNLNNDETEANRGGKYVFNAGVSGSLNLYNNANVILGQKLQSNDTTSNGRFNLSTFSNDANGGFINALNDIISADTREYDSDDPETRKVISGADTRQKLGVVTLNSNLKLAIDADGESGLADTFAITEEGSNFNGNKLILQQINLLSQPTADGIVVADDTTKAHIDVASDTMLTGFFGTEGLTTAAYNAADGKLSFATDDGKARFGDDIGWTLSRATLATDPANRNYSMSGDEIVTAENPLSIYDSEGNLLQSMGGTSLSINTNGYNVNGNGQSGIVVGNGQTFALTGGGTWSGFNVDNVTGNGILQILTGSNVTNIGTIDNPITFSDNVMYREDGTAGGIMKFAGSTVGDIYVNMLDNSLTTASGNANSSGFYFSRGSLDGVNYIDTTINSLNGNFIRNHVESSAETTGYAIGGAGRFNQYAQVGLVNANFVENYAKHNGAYNYARGGALDIGNFSYVGQINSSFVKNSAISEHTEATGGAIANFSGSHISLITGKDFEVELSDGTTVSGNGFYGNTAVSTDGAALGGAIYNTNAIDIINADFTGNEATSENSYAQGGAIYNSGIINMIQGTFKNNIAKGEPLYDSTYQTGGGAIFNAGTINDIHADFEGNIASLSPSASSTHYYLVGDAIYNTGTINNITGNFVKNKGEAGAIYNRGNITITDSTFVGNGTGASDRSGAAIQNSGTITVRNSLFDGNRSGSHGGAVYNNGIATFIDTDFLNNANPYGGKGGAIHNGGTIYIIAQAKDVTFHNNKSNEVSGTPAYDDIDSEGTGAKTYLNAAIDRVINFGGKIGREYSYVHGTVYINSGTQNVGGTYIFNSDVADAAFIYGGTIKLGKKEQENGTTTVGSFTNLTNESELTTLDLRDNEADDRKITTLTLNKAINLAIDADLASLYADKLKVTTLSGSGNIVLNSVNIAVGTTADTATVLVADSNLRSQYTVSNNLVKNSQESSIEKGGVVYNSITYNSTDGTLTFGDKDVVASAISTKIGTWTDGKYIKAYDADNPETTSLGANLQTLDDVLDNNYYRNIKVSRAEKLKMSPLEEAISFSRHPEEAETADVRIHDTTGVGCSQSNWILRHCLRMTHLKAAANDNATTTGNTTMYKKEA